MFFVLKEIVQSVLESIYEGRLHVRTKTIPVVEYYLSKQAFLERSIYMAVCVSGVVVFANRDCLQQS